MTIRISERLRTDSNLNLKIKAFSLSMISRFNGSGKPLLSEYPFEGKSRREIAVFSFKNFSLNKYQSLKTTVTHLSLGSM